VPFIMLCVFFLTLRLNRMEPPRQKGLLPHGNLTPPRSDYTCFLQAHDTSPGKLRISFHTAGINGENERTELRVNALAWSECAKALPAQVCWCVTESRGSSDRGASLD